MLIRKTETFEHRKISHRQYLDIICKDLVTTYWFLFIPVYRTRIIYKYNL